VTDLGGSGSLARIARAIALKIVPGGGTPEYFEVYKSAVAQPERCSAAQAEAFTSLYRQAVIRFRARLNRDNLDSFYAGLCESWKDAQERVQQTVAEAQARRDEVISQNAMAEMSAEASRTTAKVLRNAALGFAFTGLVAFMIIALFLAFLAIEGHSAAVRQAVELLASERSLQR
jgi:hypothetical protein